MKEVKDFPGYFITEEGKVYTSKRNQFREMKQPICRKYHAVNLSHKGNVKHCFVHRLVAEAFVDNPENKDYVNHIDGNKLNNHYTNLEWVTFSENIQHAFEVGLNKGLVGEENGRALLNDTQVVEIYKRLQSGEKSISLAKEFGVEQTTIGNIKRKRLWKHITDSLDDIFIKPKAEKMDDDIVHKICKMLADETLPTPIAKELNVPVDLVYDLKRRKGFKHITSLYEW